jgi:hypothetical protein
VRFEKLLLFFEALCLTEHGMVTRKKIIFLTYYLDSGIGYREAGSEKRWKDLKRENIGIPRS